MADKPTTHKPEVAKGVKVGDVVLATISDGSEVPAIVHAVRDDGLDLVIFDGNPPGVVRNVPERSSLSKDEVELRRRQALGLSPSSDFEQPEVRQDVGSVVFAGTWRKR